MSRGSNLQKPYPPEFRREAVALYRREGRRDADQGRGRPRRSSESLRIWVKEVLGDAGQTRGAHNGGATGAAGSCAGACGCSSRSGRS